MCKIKYLLSYIYIHCSTWKIMICWHLQEWSSNSKEQMKIARRCRYLGHLRSLWKNARHLTVSQHNYVMPSIYIKHFLHTNLYMVFKFMLNGRTRIKQNIWSHKVSTFGGICTQNPGGSLNKIRWRIGKLIYVHACGHSHIPTCVCDGNQNWKLETFNGCLYHQMPVLC